jgi:hypothetical protein
MIMIYKGCRCNAPDSAAGVSKMEFGGLLSLIFSLITFKEVRGRLS